MAITITVPADTKTPGTAGHTSDHNVMSDALTALGTAAANTAGDTFTGPVTFADASKVTSSGYVGKDAVTYGPLGRKVSFATGQAVSALVGAPVAIAGITVACGVGTYRFRIHLDIKANASAGQWVMFLNVPTSTVGYRFRYISAAGVVGLTGNLSAAGSGTPLNGPATSVTGFYDVEIEGQIVVTVAGNLSLSGYTTVGADTWNVFTGSSIELIQVS